MDKITLAVNEAKQAAVKATEDYLKAHPNDWFPCGFSWVTVRPGTSPLARYLKRADIGDKGYEGGIQVWNPSGSPTQCLAAIEAGSRAYKEVLQKHFPELSFSVGSRWD